MFDTSGRFVIVFNGEIFNYQSLSDKYLRTTWETIGAPRTRSDTEVLLYLLIKFGTKCISWLSGFFAIAFYDTQRKELLLIRDRFGKKPLNYFASNGYIAFASELKALFELGIPAALDYSSLQLYLQFNYVPQPHSMIRGIRNLRPGHYLRISSGQQGEEQPYYTLQPKPGSYGAFTYEQARNELVNRLDQSVKDRLISDVPLGAFLSGGVDSSVIVALAARHTDHLSTFSIGYKDNRFFDETHYANLVAQKYKTHHTVFSLKNEDFLSHIEGVLDYLDEPFGDSSAIPLFILSKETRKHVTVALSGDGADEVFAGYNKHHAEWRIRQRSMSKSLVISGMPVWNALPKSRNNYLTNLFRQLHRFAAGGRLSPKERYWQWASINTSSEAAALLHPDIQAKVSQASLEHRKQSILSQLGDSDFNDVLLTDVNLVLLSDMLVKVDLMSMANSLEVRCPFLDHRVADFAFGLPASYKIDRASKKKIVRDAFRSMLPPELYNRPKHGFEIPLLDWFRRELWSTIDNGLLKDSFIEEQALFHLPAIVSLKKKLQSHNPEDSVATVWALIVFQHWWKKYLS